MYAFNFGASGIMVTKLFQAAFHQSGMIIWVQFLEGLPRKIWEGVMNCAIFLKIKGFGADGPQKWHFPLTSSITLL